MALSDPVAREPARAIGRSASDAAAVLVAMARGLSVVRAARPARGRRARVGALARHDAVALTATGRPGSSAAAAHSVRCAAHCGANTWRPCRIAGFTLPRARSVAADTVDADPTLAIAGARTHAAIRELRRLRDTRAHRALCRVDAVGIRSARERTRTIRAEVIAARNANGIVHASAQRITKKARRDVPDDARARGARRPHRIVGALSTAIAKTVVPTSGWGIDWARIVVRIRLCLGRKTHAVAAARRLEGRRARKAESVACGVAAESIDAKAGRARGRAAWTRLTDRAFAIAGRVAALIARARVRIIGIDDCSAGPCASNALLAHPAVRTGCCTADAIVADARQARAGVRTGRSRRARSDGPIELCRRLSWAELVDDGWLQRRLLMDHDHAIVATCHEHGARAKQRCRVEYVTRQGRGRLRRSACDGVVGLYGRRTGTGHQAIDEIDLRQPPNHQDLARIEQG